ncbi:hypothetical protein FDC45_14925 [Clostridium botulinum]|uniref:Uncharacterized protein n=1 Tax=Clostridium botulinum TaxID=1491 RepID=A0A846J915_CLOBO|nr:hypothetical protein [Clostridium botulinum]ACA55217.1 hypothetical protein CLK_0903 [Clostridium botulinum A3 str. Loch Maree]NFH66877.1 hypothetical protein [Clostridium botulinum]NFJ10606.1 hypothetical protein [Clostridium botulinum]NFK15526.1 hypothetical protein [Clostridium botulinum]NFM95412.1 hypothetical protein [Clostridium botulinum]
MSSFKIICNKCGKESIIQQSNDNVEIKGNIVIEYWDRDYDINKIFFVCECGNKVEDK